MVRRKALFGFLIAALLLGAQLVPGAVLAAETRIAISPGYGPPGTQFQIAVTGLLENDDFSIAIYRTDDGKLVAQDTFTSEPDGSIIVTYDSTGKAPGLYHTVVTYLARGNQVIAGDFTISGPSSGSSRFFPETGFTVSGRFLTYWETNGGLALNGFPISAARDEKLEDGKTYTVQYFERVRMEYHPENAAPNDVLLGQFGRRIHPADPPAAQIVGALYFSETGHNLSDITTDRKNVVNFARYFDNNGGLRQFGYPITEIFPEKLDDGNTYQVQYFERARFEYHPENKGTPYEVLLGQFGRRILAEAGGH
jgi:hypothetical protein